MPELPEVEITRRGLAPQLIGQQIKTAVIRNRALRWPIPRSLARSLAGKTIKAVARRGKYLLIDCESGALILHLGMSGSLRVIEATEPVRAHEHFDLALANGRAMRLRDPRRFGAVLWQRGDPLAHVLLAGIGPEPLSAEFDGAALYRTTRGRTASIKALLLDSRIVAGIGNIYANEALFCAGIHPEIAAGRLSRKRCDRLAIAIKQTLLAAIEAGGSSLRDYVAADGELGCFQLRCAVYARGGLPCARCGSPIRVARLSQRSTYHCARCQR